MANVFGFRLRQPLLAIMGKVHGPSVLALADERLGKFFAETDAFAMRLIFVQHLKCANGCYVIAVLIDDGQRAKHYGNGSDAPPR